MGEQGAFLAAGQLRLVTLSCIKRFISIAEELGCRGRASLWRPQDTAKSGPSRGAWHQSWLFIVHPAMPRFFRRGEESGIAGRAMHRSLA